MNEMVYLNASAIKNHLIEKSLKQWWVAEQLKIDRRTLSRWLSGSVKKTDFATAVSLAAVLEVELNKIVVETEEELLASPEDQKQAARLLSTSILVDKLGPIGEWDILEKLLKATLIPNLPKTVLGELYNQLSVASWRQNKIDEARIYATKSIEIGNATGDKGVLSHALLNLANIYSWDGNIQCSLDSYRQCLAMRPFLGVRKTGSTLNNMGAVLWEIGEFEKGLTCIDEGLKCFQVDGQAMNKSIAHAQRALILLELQRLDEAKESIDLAMSHATRGHYLAGISFAKLILAEWSALVGRIDELSHLINLDGHCHTPDGIMSHLNYEIATRAYRIAKRYDEAIAILAVGFSLKTQHSFPMSLAALHREGGYLMTSANRPDQAEKHFEKSLELYRKCGALLRVSEIEKFQKLS